MNTFINKISKMNSGYMLIILLFISLSIGYYLGSTGSKSTTPVESETAGATDREVQIWTCSMHPQIRQPGPGKCPICGMDLIPVKSGGDGQAGPREISLSEHARKLAEIEVAAVDRRFVSTEIRMVGKIDYDETLVGYITAWVPGRLARLYVDYTGIPVNKGDHMVYMYSPDLFSAQQELLQAIKAESKLRNSSITSMKETALLTVNAAREKLTLLGLKEWQINQIVKEGKPNAHMTIYAPMSGIVIHKNAIEGMYVQTGTRIYTIADLSRLWLKLDAYESDLSWLRYGQDVEFTTQAYPGEVFEGKISFIEPVLNAKTRTVKVRVNVPNPDGKLKPEMFAHAIARSSIAAAGKVMDPALTGKWICPMHPEIIKVKAGSCDICGMPLVSTESLGYSSVDESSVEIPLVIPASAPLITGKRAVVYVEIPGKEGSYEGREIVLGPRAGDYYLVREGLIKGEKVVVNGNFKIDSAIQIMAKPSMMNPEGGGSAPGHRHGSGTGHAADSQHDSQDREEPPEKQAVFSGVSGTFKSQLDDVLNSYFMLHEALSRDNFEDARNAAQTFLKALGKVDMKLLKDDAHMTWMKKLADMEKSSGSIVTANDIEEARKSFAPLSDSLAYTLRAFGTSGKQSIYRYHCSMAFEGIGADWLQNKTGTENPYYGAAMFACGDQVEVMAEGPMNGGKGEHGHGNR